jgi:uncharacterized protein (DUF58 family)
MILFTTQVERYVPPGKGARHVLRLIRDLLYLEPGGRGTDLSLAFEHLNRVARRRCVVFLVSDFQAEGYEWPMRVARRRHDLIPITITDPRETELTDVGLIELTDAETGETVLVDTSDIRLRQRYSEHAANAARERGRIFRQCNVDSVDIRAGESFVEPLNRFFRARKARL